MAMITAAGVGLILLICVSLTFSATAYGQQELKLLEEQKEAEAVIESLLEEEMAVVMGDETAVMQPKGKRRYNDYRSMRKKAKRKPFKKERSNDLMCSDQWKLNDKKVVAKLPDKTAKAIKDYLLADLQTTHTFSKVDCDASRSLTLYDLMEMANTMFRDEWGYYPKKIFPNIVERSKSFAYLPGQQNCNAKLYKSSMYGRLGSGNIHATGNHKDSEMFLTQECPAVKLYWSAWTPCRLCVHSLIAWKQTNSPNEHVIIRVATLYLGKGTDEKMTIYCLALMWKKGFRLRPWFWQLFAEQAHLTGKCAEVVELIPHCKEFQVLDSKMRRYVKQAETLSIRSEDWLTGKCPDPR